MTPLFAFKSGASYKWTMTVGPVTLDWEDWTLVLLVLAGSFTLLSVFFARWYGRGG